MPLSNPSGKTTKIWLTNRCVIGLDQYESNIRDGFQYGFGPDNYSWNHNANPSLDKNRIVGRTGTIRTPLEEDYIDIGYVTDEREELALGGLGFTLPGSSSDQRISWSISGKVTRITITGIITDGVYKTVNGYTGVGDGQYFSEADNVAMDGASNVSVFKFKMNKLLSYQKFQPFDNIFPNIIQYKRYLLHERRYVNTPTGSINYPEVLDNKSELAFFVIVGYSSAPISGTRHLSYNLSLEQVTVKVGDIVPSWETQLSNNIKPRGLGEK